MFDYWANLLRAKNVQNGIIKRYWRQLKAAYSDAGRHYHTMQHLQSMFVLFKEFELKLQHSEEVFMAICYHDVVYDTRKKDNEKQSARLAVEHLAELNFSEKAVSQVSQLILDTHKHLCSQPENFDNMLFLDIDLSILGSSMKVYNEYASNIRREYKWVGEKQYIEGRSAVLENFLKRPRLFFTEEMAQRFENQARNNLENELLMNRRIVGRGVSYRGNKIHLPIEEKEPGLAIGRVDLSLICSCISCQGGRGRLAFDNPLHFQGANIIDIGPRTHITHGRICHQASYHQVGLWKGLTY